MTRVVRAEPAPHRLRCRVESMSQPSLFDAGERVLLDNPSGRIVYRPDVVPPQAAAAWFAELRDTVDWRGERRRMYDRDVDVPRLTAHVDLGAPGLSPLWSNALAAVRSVVAAPFDAVGLNLYRDQHDSVAPHSDRLAHIADGSPVALLSLGATRRMTIRARAPLRGVLHIDLEPGSVLVMSHATQLHHEHGVPKQRVATGARISLAFRVLRRRDALPKRLDII